MDKLTFVAEVVKALVWPATALILTFMLRKPISELIPFLRKLKYKEIEMEFSREIAELKAEVPPAPVQPVHPDIAISEGLPDRLNAKRDELMRMVSFSTRVAVMEAWLEVEAAATEVAHSFWSVSSSGTLKSFSRLGEYLFQSKVIDQKQLQTFKRLQQLRNKAAHAQELDLSEDDAQSYVEVALALATHIRAHY
ncbi:hypothetical protein [Chromobacterium piscinae]|uniref:hypothetical protein n=1 Tax=Chromobacterium piscinae TaxID=686831 RepID=UPI0032097DA7